MCLRIGATARQQLRGFLSCGRRFAKPLRVQGNTVKKSPLILGMTLVVAVAKAQTSNQAWVQRYSGPGVGIDMASAIVADSGGNAYVTGYSWGGSSGHDYATIAYSSEGVPLWTNRYNGPGNESDQAKSVAVDSNQNVYVTGWSKGDGSGSDYATIAYSVSGMPLWTNYYNGPAGGNDVATALAVGRNSNVYVTGLSANLQTWPYNYDYVTIAYSSAGVALWTNRYRGPSHNNAEASAIAVNGTGNVFITGASRGPDYYYHYATIGYSTAGTPLWTNRYSGRADVSYYPTAIAVDDKSGNVYVTGSSEGNVTHDYATVGYSSDGTPLWTNRYSGGLGAAKDQALAVAVDDNRNVYVAGRSQLLASLNEDYDYATIAYSSSGLPLWTNRYSGGFGDGNDEALAVAVNDGGNVYVTGKSHGGSNGADCLTIAYSNTGLPLWTNRYNGPANGGDIAFAVAADRLGNVFITGFSDGGTNSSYDFVTVKYSSTVRAYLDTQNVNNQLVLSWTNAALALQSAPAISGTFTNLPGATSPYTNPISGAQQFFRLISN